MFENSNENNIGVFNGYKMTTYKHFFSQFQEILVDCFRYQWNLNYWLKGMPKFDMKELEKKNSKFGIEALNCFYLYVVVTSSYIIGI